MQMNSQNKDGGMNSRSEAQIVSAVTAAVVQTLSGMDADGQNGSQKAQDQPKTINLIGLMFHILEKFWLVMILAVLFAFLFGLRAKNAVPTYTATAKLYIVNPTGGGISISDLQLGTVLTLDYQEVFKTWEVHEMVREELNLPYSYQQMQSMIQVVNPEDTRILYIYATHTSAQTAADIANAYAKAAKEFIINTMRGEEPSDFSIALVPSVAQMASKSSSVVKGFLLGSVLAVGILTLMFVLDDHPRTPEDISVYGGIPTLAVLPSRRDIKRFQKSEQKAHKSGKKGKAA